jgi:ribosome-associated translation inhibitor RaiA
MTKADDELDFTLEVNSEGLSQVEEGHLFAEADSRLRSLAKGRTDLIGAAVSLKKPAYRASSHFFEASVVDYVRPSNIAATEKEDGPMMALKGALDGVERQIRQKRTRLKKSWERPGNDPVSREIEELDSAESM